MLYTRYVVGQGKNRVHAKYLARGQLAWRGLLLRISFIGILSKDLEGKCCQCLEKAWITRNLRCGINLIKVYWIVGILYCCYGVPCYYCILHCKTYYYVWIELIFKKEISLSSLSQNTETHVRVSNVYNQYWMARDLKVCKV